MSMHIVGSGHNVVRHGQLRMWAENGLIHIEDGRDGGYDTISVRTCLHRIKAHNDMLKNSRESMKRSKFMNSEEYAEIQSMVERMSDVCAQAQIQGQPFDASACRDLRRRQPKTVLMPGYRTIM